MQCGAKKNRKEKDLITYVDKPQQRHRVKEERAKVDT
jgi:hypothetical protein